MDREKFVAMTSAMVAQGFHFRVSGEAVDGDEPWYRWQVFVQCEGPDIKRTLEFAEGLDDAAIEVVDGGLLFYPLAELRRPQRFRY